MQNYRKGAQRWRSTQPKKIQREGAKDAKLREEINKDNSKAKNLAEKTRKVRISTKGAKLREGK